MTTLLIDGIRAISVTNGIVRVECVTAGPNNEERSAGTLLIPGNRAAAILQSQTAIDSFEAVNVGILRIQQLRNPYFSDDRERYEASPSFDFTLTHHQTIITSVAVITSTEFQVLDV